MQRAYRDTWVWESHPLVLMELHVSLPRSKGVLGPGRSFLKPTAVVGTVYSLHHSLESSASTDQITFTINAKALTNP